MRNSFPRYPLLLFLFILLASCVSPTRRGKVFFYSEPSGAEILVDGKPTGAYTPCALDLNLFHGKRKIEFVKKGYKRETREIFVKAALGISRITTAADYDSPMLFPLWWTFEDVLLPVKFEAGLYPQKVFARLDKKE